MLNALDLDMTKLVELNVDGQTKKSVFAEPSDVDKIKDGLRINEGFESTGVEITVDGQRAKWVVTTKENIAKVISIMTGIESQMLSI